MNGQLIWAVLAVLVLIVVGAGTLLVRRSRSKALRTRFGPEYERMVRRLGDVKKAEANLAERAHRVERLAIRPLAPEDKAKFSSAWRDVQQRFVNDPAGSVTDANHLVGAVMQARGYPLDDFEQRAEDLSVDHPTVVVHYRAARLIAEAHERDRSSTEDLRQAMIHYRVLFEDLLDLTPHGIEERAVAHG